MFSEIRATTSWAELKAMGKAGMQKVQFGIEALSTPLLKKLHKRKIWQPVRQKMATWHKIYNELHQGPSRSPILFLRAGGDFLIIRQRRTP